MAYCEKDRKYLKKLKAAYESVVGRRYSHEGWKTVKRRVLRSCEAQSYLSEEFAVALMHHAYAVRLKQKLNLGASTVEVANQVLTIAQNIEGVECWQYAENLFKHLKINPPRSTRYWFFKKLGGFEAWRQLTPEDKIVLTYKALQWKLNREEGNEQLIQKNQESGRLDRSRIAATN